MSKPKIAFICVHNSCRSQIAEAFGTYKQNKHLKSSKDFDITFCHDLIDYFMLRQ